MREGGKEGGMGLKEEEEEKVGPLGENVEKGRESCNLLT